MRSDLRLPTSVALLLILAMFAGPAGASSPRPRVALLDSDPVVVSGRYFKPGERVIVRTSIKHGKFTKTVVATAAGRFTARLANVDANCSVFVVTAVGATGSRATLRRINIPPPCSVPITP